MITTTFDTQQTKHMPSATNKRNGVFSLGGGESSDLERYPWTIQTSTWCFPLLIGFYIFSFFLWNGANGIL